MPEPSPDEFSETVLAAQKGDEDAFRVLYRVVQPRMLRYLQTQVGADAEDIAADAWLQIARDLGTFDGDGAGFRAWAVTIARYRVMDHWRRQQRRPASAMPIDDLPDRPGPFDTAGAALDSLATREAMRMIAGLPPDQAEAVLLRVLVGLDAESAAQVLGKRSGAVRTAAYRGLRKLAKQLTERNGEVPA